MSLIREAVSAGRDALIEQFQLPNQHEEPLTGNRRLDRAGGEESLDVAARQVAETGGVILVTEIDGRVAGHMCLTFEIAPERDRARPSPAHAERPGGQYVGTQDL